MRRTGLTLTLLALVLVAAFAVLWLTRPRAELAVVTWAGGYGRAQASAQFRPYEDATRTDIRIREYDGGLTELRRAVQSRRFDRDVIDLELPDAVRACREGLLERIDAADLPSGNDGMPASADLIPGAIGPCWIGGVVYSQVIAFNPRAEAPTRLEDIFDTAHFPGARGLNAASAKYNLELALLADGVPPAGIYPTLSRPDGVARALAKLATLPIVWWRGGAQATALLRDGRARFTTMLNGDYFAAATAANAMPIAALWDRQLYALDVFGIPAGNPRKRAAMDFIRFATGSRPLAGVAGWMPYGPARRSSLALVRPNPDTHVIMRPYLPTAHFDTAMLIDENWWQAHETTVTPQWSAFVAAHGTTTQGSAR